MSTITLIAYLPDLSGIKFIIQENKTDKEPLFYFVFPPDYSIEEANKINEAMVASAIQKHFYQPLNKTIEIKRDISESLKKEAELLKKESDAFQN